MMEYVQDKYMIQEIATTWKKWKKRWSWLTVYMIYNRGGSKEAAINVIVTILG